MGFAVTINGSPLNDYQFRPSSSSITYTLGFEMRQAAAASGMTFPEFLALPGDPIWTNDENPVSKADVLIWYRLSQRIPAVQQDIQSREIELKSRRRGG